MAFRIALFDSKSYDEKSFNKCLKEAELNTKIELHFFTEHLDVFHAELCKGFDAVCCFVNDKVDAACVDKLHSNGVKLILARCAGFDMIDLKACKEKDISVARVPEYSPHAVAEFAIASLMTLNRKLHKAYNRVRDGNFTLSGLVGVDLFGKTFGVVGTGKIGCCLADIAIGYGCKVLAYDVYENAALKAKEQVTYVPLDQLFKEADIISLHAPLFPTTKHMVNERTLNLMKPTAMIVNTSRGGLIDSKALLAALTAGKISGAALDVYENEQKYFFNDVSDAVMDDDILSHFQNMNNVLVTSHQAFLTVEALDGIGNVTLSNACEFLEGKRMEQLKNYVAPPKQ